MKINYGKKYTINIKHLIVEVDWATFLIIDSPSISSNRQHINISLILLTKQFIYNSAAKSIDIKTLLTIPKYK